MVYNDTHNPFLNVAVMSLPTISFGDRFCFSRKGGIGGGGWVHPKGADRMAISGLSFRNALVGAAWVGHCCPLMYKQVENSPLTLHSTHFW